MAINAFDDQPPNMPQLTPYDELHVTTYLRLLDAEHEGADWKEVVQIVFGLDPVKDPQRARLVHDSHLARAHWMTITGYREFLQSAPQ